MAKDDVVVKVNADTKGFLAGMNKAKLAMVAVGAAVAAGIGKAIQTAAEIETIQARFTALTGSVETAQKHMKDLLDFGAKTPFEIKGIADASAVLQSFGIASADVVDHLRKIGDVSSASGKDLKELAVIYGQVMSRGQLETIRLNQLQEAGVPILKSLAKEMGVYEHQVRQLVTKGAVDVETFQKAFADLSEEGGFAFEAMQLQSETLNGKLSNLDDAFYMLLGTIGDAFLPAAKWTVDALIEMVEWTQEAVKWFRDLTDNMSQNASSIWNWITGEDARIKKMMEANGVTKEQIEAMENQLEVEKEISRQQRERALAKEREEAKSEAARARALEAQEQLEAAEKKRAEKAVKMFQKMQEDKAKFLEKFLRKAQKARDKEAREVQKAEEQKRRDRADTLSHFVTMGSKNNEIAKASALGQTAIQGEKAATSAYAWGNTWGGPPGGTAMAALAWAFTAKRLAAISGIGLYDGGTVMGGMGRSQYRDSVPANLAVGETVISKNLTEKLGRMAERPSLQQFDQRTEVVIQGDLVVDDDDKVDMLIERINSRVEDGNARLVSTDTRK